MRRKQTCQGCYAYGELFGLPFCYLGWRMQVDADAIEKGRTNVFRPAELCTKCLTKNEFRKTYKQMFPEYDITEILFVKKQK